MIERFLKYLFCILFLLFLTISHVYSQWHRITSNTSSRLNSIYFINENTGWICGFESVLKTTNGGNTWSSNFLNGNHKSIYFNNINTGWICGDNGRLYKTTDSGENWFLVNVNLNTSLNQISFANEITGYIAGNMGTILKTTNSGMNWFNTINTNSVEDFHSLKIVNNEVIIATGTNSIILKTTNSGSSWDSTSFGVPNPLVTIDFVNENNGWVSGCCGMFLRTTNAGVNWTPEVFLTLGYTINSMTYLNENFGWVAGDAGYILRTTNGGISWDSLNSTTSSGLHSVFFINKDTGFISGYNGLILKTTNGGGEGFPIGIEQIVSAVPEEFSLHQNYPNPFNPVTHLEFGIPEMGLVSLKVFNISGIEVADLIDKYLYPGKYSVNFDGSNLSSGIYFYKLRTKNFVETKRMMLLK